ncbi:MULTISPECIES: hypothetical protein [Metallosphaera]|uniref:Glycosyl transferase, family 2 n=3 Tax=Metallosphaera TaxID=41980 RepID=A4YFN9_METS5|nr:MULTISPECIES: hypothetical protein [Metallosphaera]ABP95241.1 hypothetical protein Msed_1077 [Metallosphaera sedula DSM 5348]AIM27227.1 hypothetical protein HA72_1077 [Metallosphaera sedula]MCY0863037.1 hypothetical protein [Metallosphaera prunae]QCO29265.1 hypothetical protein DFR88_01135 [Metallosphaera prunae]WPX07264.1 hypothetical protein SOJ17_001025 [Metallosphaera sedula DSM 5348]
MPSVTITEEIERLFRGSPEDVKTIYSRFSREDIIKWMRERPSADMRFVEVEGDKEVIVVVPTANASGELARRTRSHFAGLHLVFVESNGPLFNYARSVNAGVNLGLSYDPKWVVISNDDLTRVEGVSKLKDQLSTVSNADLVMASPSSYHTYPVLLMEPKSWFIKGMGVFGKMFRMPPAKVYGELLAFREKLGIRYVTMIESMVGPMAKVAGKSIRVLNAGSFAVIRPRRSPLDETFINSHEDLVLSMTSRYTVIKYKIDEERGASLGFGEARFVRTFVNEIYLNYLLEKGLLPI